MFDGRASGRRARDLVPSHLSKSCQLSAGRTRLTKRLTITAVRDMFRHALIAKIVKVEIVARHQLQIGSVWAMNRIAS